MEKPRVQKRDGFWYMIFPNGSFARVRYSTSEDMTLDAAMRYFKGGVKWKS